MKTLLAGLLLTLVISCGGSTSNREMKIELNGDSILHGHLLAVSPAMKLKELRPHLVIQNRAEVGLTLHSLVNGYDAAWLGGPVPILGFQLPFAELQRTSDVVVISVGGNDAYANTSIIRFESELRHIVSTIKSEGRIPVLTGIIQLTPSDYGFDVATVNRTINFNSVINKVATEMHVLNANWSTVAYTGLSDTTDGIHRTQSASDLLVIRLAETLDKIK